MSRIHVNRFLGIAPRLAPSVLDERQAQRALDVKLWSGRPRGIGGLIPEVSLSKSGSINTIYLYNDGQDWLHWTQTVNAVPGPIAGDALEKLYFTGTDKPRITTNELFDDGTPGTSVPPASWILGLPNPTSAPVASANGAGNINASATWVMTFVRKFSDGTIDESGPSPVSNSLTLANERATVTLPDGSMSSPADYGITHKRLYRNEGSGYLFVTEQTFATANFEDNTATVNLGDLIATTSYLPPPDEMIGLIVLPNGVLAGFKGNEVYLSEPFRPHAYPLVNRYAVNWPIVGLGAVGNTIIVITEAYPFIGRGVDPAAYSFKSQPGLYPCTSARGIASGEIGVLWPTPNGLALCDGVNIINATAEFITRDEWQARFFPSTLIGIFHSGRYYGWYHDGTFDADGNKLGGGFIIDRSEPAFMTQLSGSQFAAYAAPETDKVYVVRKYPLTGGLNHLFQWDADPSTPLEYEWKSKTFITAGMENFSFAQIIADYGETLSDEEIAALEAQIAAVEAFNNAQPTTDGPLNAHLWNGVALNDDNVLQDAPDAEFLFGGVTFMYWADGDLKLTRSVVNNEPFPLPAGFLAEKHEFQVRGATPVDQVTLAGSFEELGGI